MRIRSTVAAIATAALLLTGCSDSGSDAGGDSSNSAASGESSVDFVTIAAGGTSGAYYQIGAAMSQVLSDTLGADSSVQA